MMTSSAPSLPNPFGVTPAAEYLAVPQDVPLYNESMFFCLWDADHGIGLWAQQGVAPGDNTLWRGEVFIYLPGGELLASLSSGRAPGRDGPSTGNLTFRCLTPLREWQVTFDGLAERTTEHAVTTRLVGAGRTEPVKAEFTFRAVTPVYDMYPAIGRPVTPWSQVHHEQGLHAHGSLTVGSDRVELAGPGFRDHGRGTRDLSDMGGDAMISVVFPDGRVLGCVKAWKRDGTVAVNEGFLWEAGEFKQFTIVDIPDLESPSGRPRAFTARYRLDDGRTIELGCELLHTAVISIDSPNHWMLGLEAADPDMFVMVETPARFSWDGMTAYGNVERSIRRSRMNPAY